MKNVSNVDQGFIERFRKLTDDLQDKFKCSIKGLPEALGLSFKHHVLMNYRTGRNEPQSYVYRELRKKTGVDLNWLICGDTPEQASDNKRMDMSLIQSIWGGDVIKDAKYIRITDNFNSPINNNSIAIYTDHNFYIGDGHYVVSLFSTGVNLVRKIVQVGQNSYKVIPGSDAPKSVEAFTVSNEDINFIGKVWVVLSKSD
jgi:hypothetical protein